LPVG
jgi:hypothetical protein